MRFSLGLSIGKAIGLTLAAAIIAGGFYLLGRVTADSDGARQRGYANGHDAGYFDGLNAGVAQGREEGRALQAGSSVAPDSRQPVQDAFTAGYTAGVADAFGNFDGGWEVTAPYLLTVERGANGSVYRISSRTLLLPDVSYFLCADRHSVCTAPKH